MMACRYIRNRSPRGFTIIEMMVAMAIAAIFLTIFIGVVVATFQTLRTGDERTAAQQNARVAMRFIVRDVKQAIEIAPRRLEEPIDPVFGDLPRDENSLDPFDPTGTRYSYPIYRRSVDGASNAYIDLSHDGATGDGDEYDQFRDDGRPYDIRPLAPNRLELLLNTDDYFSHTQYFGDDPETPAPDLREYNLDLNNGGPQDNPQSLRTRITYEHQIVPPMAQVYINAFDGNRKDFKLPMNRSGSPGVASEEEFCIVRSFEPEFLDDALNLDVIRPSVADPNLYVDAYSFRQPVADHIVDIRFRYWNTGNNDMVEIRYDPNIEHAYNNPQGSTGTPIDTDDGYYRYFTSWGQEIYVWFDYDRDEMVNFVDPTLSNPFSAVQPYCFYMYTDLVNAGWEEYQRGILLFEGWRFINMVSVTIRATNRENLEKFKASIDPTLTTARTDYQVGYVDFGKGTAAPTGIEDNTNQNILDPFYRATDNYRANSVIINGNEAWDFVEPNINPAYDPNSFVTLEMFVAPTAMKTSERQNEFLLAYGFSYRGAL